MKIKILILFLLLCSTQIHAQRVSPPGVATFRGFPSCADYLQHRKNGDLMDDYDTAWWVMGYITAYNNYGTNPQIKVPDPNTIWAYMDKFCRNQPLQNVLTGTYELISDLGGAAAPKYK